jgi:hypothetical protein
VDNFENYDMPDAKLLGFGGLGGKKLSTFTVIKWLITYWVIQNCQQGAITTARYPKEAKRSCTTY